MLELRRKAGERITARCKASGKTMEIVVLSIDFERREVRLGIDDKPEHFEIERPGRRGPMRERAGN